MTGWNEELRQGFPGPRVAGFAMILGPVLLLAGAILLIPFEAATLAERQDAYRTETTRAMLGLEFFVAGWFLSLINVTALAGLVSRRSPRLGRIAGTWALLGVTVSLFFGGIATYEIAQSRITDLEVVTMLEAGAEPPLVILLGASGIVFGWILLAVGTFRTGILPAPRALAFGLTGLLPLTVLGGYPITMPIPFVGMCIGLVPLGWSLLRKATSEESSVPPAKHKGRVRA